MHATVPQIGEAALARAVANILAMSQDEAAGMQAFFAEQRTFFVQLSWTVVNRVAKGTASPMEVAKQSVARMLEVMSQDNPEQAGALRQWFRTYRKPLIGIALGIARESAPQVAAHAKSGLAVLLEAEGNEHTATTIAARWVPVASFQAAQQTVLQFIREHDLASNFTGGPVRRDGVPVARVSYNGRLWQLTPAGEETGVELDEAGRPIAGATQPEAAARPAQLTNWELAAPSAEAPASPACGCEGKKQPIASAEPEAPKPPEPPPASSLPGTADLSMPTGDLNAKRRRGRSWIASQVKLPLKEAEYAKWSAHVQKRVHRAANESNFGEQAFWAGAKEWLDAAREGRALDEDLEARRADGRLWVASKISGSLTAQTAQRWRQTAERNAQTAVQQNDAGKQAFWAGVLAWISEQEKTPAEPRSAEAPPAVDEKLFERSRRADKLRRLAASIAQDIEKRHDSGTHHQRPTARRARIIASQEAQADALEIVHGRLLALAAALENKCEPPGLAGIDLAEHRCLPESLEGVDSRALVEDLLHHETMPRARIDAEYLRKAMALTEGLREGRPLHKAAQALLARCGAERRCLVENLAEIQAVEALSRLAEPRAVKPWDRTVVRDLRQGLMAFKRALAAGLATEAAWASARADLRTLGGTPAPVRDPVERQIRDAERALIGAEIAGYFPTPRALVSRLIAEADIRPGQRVLEPSAGKGSIAEGIRAAGVEPDVIEVNTRLRELLQLKNFRIVAEDFTTFVGAYDRIVMNPPFDNGQDIAHVQHAYRLLAPGGRLVAVMSAGPFFRSDRKAEAFRAWLGEVGGDDAELPQGSFLSSDRPTGVSTRLVVIDKPNDAAAPRPAPAQPMTAPTPAVPATQAASSCPPDAPACGLGLLGGTCTVPAPLLLPSAQGAPQPQPARFCLAEARRLIASHDPTRGFVPRADYPADVQERRYERDKGEQLKVLQIAQNMRPELIFNAAPGAIDGPPVVTEAGYVLGGNGRTMGLQLHYHQGGTAARTYLVDHAQDFGFQPAQIEALREPVVVRVVPTDGSQRQLQELVRVLNVPLTQVLDVRSESVAEARRLSADALSILAAAFDDDDTLNDYLSSHASKPFTDALRRAGILTDRNTSRYLGPAGAYTEDGKVFVERLLVAALIPDATLLDQLGAEARQTLARGAPWLLMAASYGGDAWDVRPALRAAAQDSLHMRVLGLRSSEDYLRQEGMFAEAEPAVKRHALGPLLLRVVTQLMGKPLKFSWFARAYAGNARQHPEGQEALFPREVLTPQQALRRASVTAGVTLIS